MSRYVVPCLQEEERWSDVCSSVEPRTQTTGARQKHKRCWNPSWRRYPFALYTSHSPSPLPPLGTREKTRKQFVNAGGVELLLCFLFHKKLRCQGRVLEEDKNYRLSYSSSTKQPFVWHLDSKATPPHDSTVRHLTYLFSHSLERQGDPRDEGRSVLS